METDLLAMLTDTERARLSAHLTDSDCDDRNCWIVGLFHSLAEARLERDAAIADLRRLMEALEDKCQWADSLKEPYRSLLTTTMIRDATVDLQRYKEENDA